MSVYVCVCLFVNIHGVFGFDTESYEENVCMYVIF